ncbi:hypothetical protein TNCV_6861 [Trichonephila clavipes]|nr:hypothetical protein TNCV_6861 [Trichonephila clavipes]
MTPELELSSPNYHATPTRGFLSHDGFDVHQFLCMGSSYGHELVVGFVFIPVMGTNPDTSKDPSYKEADVRYAEAQSLQFGAV